MSTVNKLALARVTAVVAITAGFVLGFASPAFAETGTPSPVIDNAGIFTPEQEANLVSEFAREFDSSGVVFVVETVDTVGDDTVEAVSLRRANELGVGDAELNNGVFFFIAAEDRDFYIQTGEGVAAKVSDAVVQDAIDTIVIPNFTEDNYEAGVLGTVAYIGDAYAGTLPVAEPAEPFDWSPVGDFFKWAGIIVGGIIAIIVIVNVWRIIAEAVGAYRDRKADELAYTRERIVERAVDGAEADTEYDRKFKALPDDAARRKYSEEALARAAGSDFGFLPVIYDRFFEAYLMRYVEWLARSKGVDIDYSRSSQIKSIMSMANPSNKSVEQVIAIYSEVLDACKVDQDNQRAIIAAREKERVRLAALAEKERVERELRNQKEAAKLWNSLDEQQRDTVNKARTKKDKIRVLDNYASLSTASRGTDMNVLFPVLFMLYGSEVGSPKSDDYHSGSSSSGGSSHSGSSSSSYTPPSFDSGGFSGGSFGGDGGGGSY